MLEKIQKQVHCATGPTFTDSRPLQKIIVMWSVLISSIGTLLDNAHMGFPCSLKYGGTFYQKKLFMEGQSFFLGGGGGGLIYGELFDMRKLIIHLANRGGVS